jgi:hypothetical protein
VAQKHRVQIRIHIASTSRSAMATHLTILPSGDRLLVRSNAALLLFYRRVRPSKGCFIDVKAIHPISASSTSANWWAHRHRRRRSHRTSNIGLASLFLPYQPPADDGSKRNSILEVQAVAPTNARSWFLGQEVVAGTISASVSFLDTLTFQNRW